MKFPFVIARRKSVTIDAPTYSNALDRVLYKYRNKFVKTTYAKNVAKHKKTMDLSNAVKQAKEQSKKKKGELVYIILEGDEFVIKSFADVKEKDDVYSIWRDGLKYEDTKTEDPAPMKVTKRPSPAQPLAAEKKVVEKVNELINKTEKMETKTKAPKAAKKVAKKAAKKVAKKAPAKKLTPKTARKFEAGKVVSISIQDMLSKMKKGFYYRDPQGVRQTEKYMKSRANQEYVREGMHEYKEGK